MHVHIVSNSLWVNSGFGKVSRYIGIGLKKLGYSVSATGVQTALRIDHDYGIPCYPLETGGHVDESTQLFLNVQNLKPDVLLYIGQMDADMNYVSKVFDKQIIHCPIEGRNIPDMMINDLKDVTRRGGEIIAQCQYGYDEMSKAGVDVSRYIYHGVDPDVFYPIQDLNKYLNDDKNVDKNEIVSEIVSVLKLNRLEDGSAKWQQYDINIIDLVNGMKGKYIYSFTGNNFGLRKQIPRLLKAYSILINENRQIKDRSILAMHTLPISIRGVNLIKNIHQLGIQDNIIFTYGSFGSSGLSESWMNIWYNLADVNITASSSEGYGLPTGESMACGIPNIGPDCSSFIELIGNDVDWNKNRGWLAKIATYHQIQDGCLLEDSPILTLHRGLQKIKDIKIGDKVLTHKGRFMRVNQIMKREYNGDMIKIIPYKLRIPIVLTPEHRILGIKTEPCSRPGCGVCYSRRDCYYTDNRRPGSLYKRCKYIKGYEPFTKYKIEWIDAKDLNIGDFVVYPKAHEKEVDIEKIRIIDYIDDMLNITGDSYDDSSTQIDIFGGFVEKKIKMYGKMVTNTKDIPAEIEISKEFLRLSGYFIAEGDIFEYGIGFTFNINEIEYIEDVENLLKYIFGLDCRHYIDEERQCHKLTVGNKILSNMFQNMFCPKEYETKKGKGKKANIVRIPPEFLNLPLGKLAELIKGEYRGDGSFESYEYNISTSSDTLANQLLYILSRFGILASIYKKRYVKNNKDGISYHVGITGKDVEIFDKIIGERHDYGERIKSSQHLKGNNFYFIPIKNIDIVKHNGNVWNIEVEEDNTYVSTIIVHNSERALVDEFDLASKMKMAYVEKDKMKVFSKNGIDFMKNYTWDKIVKQFDEVIKSMK